MKKPVALAIFLILSFSLCLLIGAQSAAASSESIIKSPANQSCLVGTSLYLNISAQYSTVFGFSSYTMYSLDGQNPIQVATQTGYAPFLTSMTYANGTTTFAPSFLCRYYVVNASVPLPPLKEGPHNLTVYIDVKMPQRFSRFNFVDQNTVTFTVANPPAITVLGEKTYASSSVPLVFWVNQSCSWLEYSLDNHSNVTITGNTTLTGLSNGNHSLVIYANGTLGSVGKSQLVSFTVAALPSSLIVVIASTVLGVVACGFLLFCFRRRKGRLFS